MLQPNDSVTVSKHPTKKGGFVNYGGNQEYCPTKKEASSMLRDLYKKSKITIQQYRKHYRQALQWDAPIFFEKDPDRNVIVAEFGGKKSICETRTAAIAFLMKVYRMSDLTVTQFNDWFTHILQYNIPLGTLKALSQ